MKNKLQPKLILSVQSSYFSSICSGKKTVEGRTSNPKFANLHEGDLLKIINAGDPKCGVHILITKLTKYESFEGMLNSEGLSNCLPGISSIEEGIRIYRNFPGYAFQESQYGVLAIGIKIFKQEKTLCQF